MYMYSIANSKPSKERLPFIASYIVLLINEIKRITENFEVYTISTGKSSACLEEGKKIKYFYEIEYIAVTAYKYSLANYLGNCTNFLYCTLHWSNRQKIIHANGSLFTCSYVIVIKPESLHA